MYIAISMNVNTYIIQIGKQLYNKKKLLKFSSFPRKGKRSITVFNDSHNFENIRSIFEVYT